MATDTSTTLDLEAPEPESSLRDDLDAAFEQAATDETAPAATTAAAPATTGRQRDPGGRFASTAGTGSGEGNANVPGDQNAPGQTAFAPGQAPVNPAQQQAPELKAPASWRPEIREKWGNVDPDVRAEIHRRESEAGRLLQSGAQTRQFVEQFEQLMRPYEMFIRAENSNPLAAVDNMMRTAAELRVGTPMSKVNLVAGIIKNFAIDLPMLDAALAGAPMPQGQQRQQDFRDPRLDHFLAQQNQQQQQAAQFEDQAIRSGLQQFAGGHEFYGDVANTMADLVEVQTRQGIAIDLEKIYARACQMHDGVSTILQQRTAAQATSGNTRAALRARRAAVSVKGEASPAGATIPKNDSVRAAIEAAFDAGDRA